MALGLCLTELFKQGDSAIYSSLRILPFVMVLIFAIIFNGHMMQRFGYYMPWYLFGSAFELVAAVLMCKPPHLTCLWHTPLVTRNIIIWEVKTLTGTTGLVKPDTSPQAIYGYTSLMALGVGFFNQAGYSVVQAKVKPEEIPWALGFMMVCECYP